MEVRFVRVRTGTICPSGQEPLASSSAPTMGRHTIGADRDRPAASTQAAEAPAGSDARHLAEIGAMKDLDHCSRAVAHLRWAASVRPAWRFVELVGQRQFSSDVE
jgi:hypothetical protein